MLKTPRMLNTFRQAPLHHVFAPSIERSFAGQLAKLPSRTAFLRRNLATSSFRNARSSQLQISRQWRSSLPRGRFQRRMNSEKASGEEILANQNLSLSERMKQMSRKYGWIVVGIYLGLSVLDFPFCFLAVRWFGTERIAELEHTIMSAFWRTAEKVVPSLKERREEKEALEKAANEATREGDSDGVVDTVKGKGKHEDASIWTQLLLAYGVHKSLIFFRIPVTLAITPKVVKTLRKWGWNIGKPRPT